MRLKQTDPEPSGFYVRSAPDQPERGPLTLENLQDLAEVGNITPKWLVRPSTDEVSQAFLAVPELMTAVFPQKKSLTFKSYQKTKDVDEGYGAVDVKSLYRCESGAPPASSGEAPPPPISPLKREGTTPVPPPPPRDSDMKVVLQASEAISQARSGRKNEPGKAPFSMGRTLQVVRWVCAVFFGVAGILVLGASGSGRLALPLFGLAAMLIILDLIGWLSDGVGRWIANAAGKPPDYTQAEQWLRAGDWSAAASAFLAVARTHPKEVRAYFEGLAAAHASPDRKIAAAFYSLARKNLGTHDLNLLNGALRRKNIPPVPPGK